MTSQSSINQQSSQSASLLFKAFLRICSFNLKFQIWSFLYYLFMSLMSRFTDQLPPWVLFTQTCLSLRLLLRIQSMRLPRTDDSALTLALDGASRGGGGGGGGRGRLRIVFLLMSYLNSASSCLIYCWAMLIFFCKSLLDSCSACLLAWLSTVSSIIIPITSLLLRSSFVSFKASNTSCHSGGTFQLLNEPSARLKEIEVFFLNEIIQDQCCYSGFLSPKKFFSLPMKVPSCYFFLAASILRFFIQSYQCIEGHIENILAFMIQPSSLFLNWKAILPLGQSNTQSPSLSILQLYWKPQQISTSKASVRVSRSQILKNFDLQCRSISICSKPINPEYLNLPCGSAVKRATIADFIEVEVSGLILTMTFSMMDIAAGVTSSCIGYIIQWTQIQRLCLYCKFSLYFQGGNQTNITDWDLRF